MLRHPLWVGDFYPYWDAVEVLDSRNTRTLAYDLIQQLVCSAARRVQGEPSDAFVLGVCQWRQAGLFAAQKSGNPFASGRNGVVDACSAGEEDADLAGGV